MDARYDPRHIQRFSHGVGGAARERTLFLVDVTAITEKDDWHPSVPGVKFAVDLEAVESISPTLPITSCLRFSFM
jgi:hypothetical protein